MTTIRASSEGVEKILRVAWQNNEPVPESDDGALPRIGFSVESPIRYALERPLWRESGDTFVFYDIYADDLIRVTFSGDTLAVGTTAAGRSRR